MKPTVLLAGMGEIGKGVYEVFSPYHDITCYDIQGEFEMPWRKYDILLVCFPWQENFINIVHAYITMHHIKSTIIFSTVPVGTTRKIQNAVHVPVEGRHPHLAESIRIWEWMMGGYNERAFKFFLKAGITPTHSDKPETTEIAKLASTTLYGVTLEFARYINDICKKNNVSYSVINAYNRRYNNLYNRLEYGKFGRSILTPPTGNIGGHCVVNNSKILQSQYPSIFNELILSDKEGKNG
jgi:hypothetical protein